MRKRWKWFAAGSLLLCMAVIIASHRQSEPTYKGRTLAQWIEIHDHNLGTTQQEATEAIIVITTNSVPLLVDWLSYDSRAKKLPPFIRNIRFLEPLLYPKYKLDHVNWAQKAFMVSQTNAICAIPALTRRINVRKYSYGAEGALYALAHIGPSALPSIGQAINNPDPKLRYAALRIISGFGTNAVAAIPNIVRTLSDPDELVRVYATNAVANIAPELLSKSPAR